MATFTGGNRLLQCAGEGNTPTMDVIDKSQTEGQEAFTSVGYSLSGEPMRHGTNANCIVLPPRILPSSCFGQSYLKAEDRSSAISLNQLWGLQGPGWQGRGGAGVPRSESNVPAPALRALGLHCVTSVPLHSSPPAQHLHTESPH